MGPYNPMLLACTLSIAPMRLPLTNSQQGLKSKDARFACKDRAALLTVLYQNITISVARGMSGLGPTLLG
jgi:hypothetical protein